MLTRFDEMMCHQLPVTMDQVHTDNPEWTERIYVSIYNVRDKDTILGFGVGQYPNKNVQDGFATVWHQGRQYNFRASRTLRPRVDEVKVGPLSVELLEGLRRFRLPFRFSCSALGRSRPKALTAMRSPRRAKAWPRAIFAAPRSK